MMGKEKTEAELLALANEEVAKLKESNSKLIDDKSEYKAKVAELEAAAKEAGDDSEELTQAKSAIAKLQEMNDIKAALIEEMDGIIKDLQTENAEGAVVVKDSDVVVTVDKKQYKVAVKKVKVKGKEFTAEQLSEEPEILNDLVKMKSGVLVLVEKG